MENLTKKEFKMTCKKVTFGKRNRRLFGIDRVQDALVSDLRLGDEGDLRTEVGDPGGHGQAQLGQVEVEITSILLDSIEEAKRLS